MLPAIKFIEPLSARPRLADLTVDIVPVKIPEDRSVSIKVGCCVPSPSLSDTTVMLVLSTALKFTFKSGSLQATRCETRFDNFQNLGHASVRILSKFTSSK